MKQNLLLLFVALLFLAACNNIEKSGPAIQAASDERDMTLEKVRELSQLTSGELERWSSYQEEIAKAQDSLINKPVKDPEQLNQLLEKFNNYGAAFAAFVQEVNNTALPFQTQQAQIDTMKKAAAGFTEYKGNYKRTLNEVNQTNADINSKLQGWQDRLKKLSQDIEADYQQIRALQQAPVQ